MGKFTFFPILFLSLFLCISTANAVLIDAGHSAVFYFDFSSDPATPPYFGERETVTWDGWIDPVLGRVEWECKYDFVSGIGDFSVSAPVDVSDSVHISGTHLLTAITTPTTYAVTAIVRTVAGTVNIDDFKLTLWSTPSFEVPEVSTAEIHGAVPEPATILLLGAGLAGLAGFGRKKFMK